MTHPPMLWPMSNLSPLPIVLRAATERDQAFIGSSWKRSLREYSPGLGNGAYYALANSLCMAVLSADPIVLVAHPPASPEVIIGWVCVEPTSTATVLWQCYVKGYARRQKVATRLLDAALELAIEEGAGPGKYFAFHTRHDSHLEAKGWTCTSAVKALHLRAASGSVNA